MQPPELLVLTWRVYEFTAYETGNYSKGLLWKASDDDSSVYLLVPFTLRILLRFTRCPQNTEAYDRADYLVVEADIANQEEGIKYMQTKMMYVGDDTLEKNIQRNCTTSLWK